MRHWPFEGREPELGVVRDAFAGSAVNAVLLLGAAGVGKTRLAREALCGLRGRTEWITATRAAASIPFGALAHLLPEEPPPPVTPVGLVRMISSRVARWGGRPAVAIGVDDAHLLDDGSSAVIAGLVRARSAFAVLTVRGNEMADCLARLIQDGEASVLELSPLPDAVIDRLIDHDTAGAIGVAERRRLHTVARGNPLALRELLHGALPGGLTDLVASRLDRLAPGTRRAVEMVACGEPVPLGFLERVAGPAAVAAAEESGLVVCEPAGARIEARLDHPVFGEVMRARMPAARSRQVYRELAGQLLSTPLRRHDDPLRAALWQVESGLIVRPDLVRAGARLAIGRAGLVLAERLARAARDADPSAAADWLLAEILEYQGRSDEAAALLPAAPPPAEAERVRWAVARADWLYWACGDLAAALDTLDAARGHSTIEGARAFLLCFAGRCADAVATAYGVLDRADSHPQGLVWAAASATASLGFLGRVDEAEALRRRGNAIAVAHAGALPWGKFQIELGACLAHLAGGHPAIAAGIAADGYRAALGGGAPMMVSGWALYGGIVAATRGDVNRAESLLTEALAGFDRNDTFRLRRCCLAALAWVHALRGDHETAADRLARSDKLDNGTNQLFAPWIGTWRAWVAHAGGDTAGAAELAAGAADRAEAAAMPVVAAMARLDAVRLGGRAPSFDSAPAGAAHTATCALAEGDPAALLRAADVLGDRGYRLHAAELATVAGGILRRAGRRGQAGIVAAKVAALRASCPGARTPLLAQDDLQELLTPREWQVALLAGRHSSKDIAGRLGLAVPTVNNTLARAYVKLGVTRRDQLRDLLDIGRRTDS
ncbi:helix-turn-helix transcriptional regulator [Paractinoplanes globisporus]|uniref:AAA family ATPase n=1 Tax=Paractinoplanes globisporus TaxID=113565 RepID=A0ABW6WBK6_9ACTN|nr:AAA family ATPase [Actinoplanes globisporus]